jgi:hypothetical protein
LSEDRIGLPLFWSNDTDLDFCHLLAIYPVGSVYLDRTLISCVYLT